ncbi:hypothetical protein OF83DRAFT_1060254 [Amylostereum chailletii]|nr:hypothetical protein OF83DRAFT_1060254 [Amylostereum chailletii]
MSILHRRRDERDNQEADRDVDDRRRIFHELVQEISRLDKGKGRDAPPTLPPLSFSSTRFEYEDLYPASPTSPFTPGPSSFGSTFSATIARSPTTVASTSAQEGASPLPLLVRMPSRRRSFSNLSIHSTRSIASRVKVKLNAAKRPGNLARKFFSRTGETSSAFFSAPATPRVTDVDDLDLHGADSALGGCFGPWKPRGRTGTTTPFPNIDFDQILADNVHNSSNYPLYHGGRTTAESTLLKGKGRSNSNPFPFPSAFEVVPPVLSDVFTPIPIALPRNSFDERLPRELQLHVLACLVQIHEDDHARRVQDGRWTAIKASKHKWVGRDQGVRELVRLSRVSKSWISLVFDGQLWTRFDLRPFPKMPTSQVLDIAKSSGSFVRSLDFSGHCALQPSTLENVTNQLSLQRHSLKFLPCTLLTSVNLNGAGSLTKDALHYLLERCPALTSLNLRGIPAVQNETCEIISDTCPHLTTLNMSRCKSLTGAGIRILASNALRDGRTLSLKVLRLSGIKGITDSVMEAVGKAAPDLEVLDLSYCRDLHNSSVEAFIACPEDGDPTGTILLSARQAGRDPNEGRRYRRRITRLRHLSFSNCGLLTDHACSHLAHTVPNLEFLELASIGAELKDDGLIRLLETTPRLRKLDLEDAVDITDDVLDAITPLSPPEETNGTGVGKREGEPGHVLEHLVVSYAANLTNNAFVALIRGCPRLRVLEADSTRISGATTKEFTTVVRARKMQDAVVVAVDCRSVGESVAKELASATRPRLGWRAYEARKLAYLDGRDDEGLGVGQDECDPARVVLKTFYGWQTVDAVAAARQKRRRGRREANGSTSAGGGGEDGGVGRARWWAPGGRRSSGTNSPSLLDTNNDRDGCIIM